MRWNAWLLAAALIMSTVSAVAQTETPTPICDMNWDGFVNAKDLLIYKNYLRQEGKNFTSTPTGTDTLTPTVTSTPTDTATVTATPTPTNVNLGLTGLWSLDENTGESTSDASGNGNDGVLTNEPVWTEGRVGSALLFDGTSHVKIGSLNVPQPSDTEGAVAFWVNLATDEGSNTFLSTSLNYCIAAESSSKIYFLMRNPDRDSVISFFGSEIPLNQWVHYTITWTDTSAQIFKDGELDAETVRVSPPYINFQGLDFYIGNDRAIKERGTRGKLDEIRLYHRTLSDSEVKALYDTYYTGPTPTITETPSTTPTPTLTPTHTLPPSQTPTPMLDINEDGVVDGRDLLLYQSQWQNDAGWTKTPTPTPTPGRIILPGGVTMDFVRITAGSFLMGSTDVFPWSGYSFVQGYEVPVHEVTFNYDFFMQKTELTQRQWIAVMGYNPSQFQDSLENPVDSVSWEDCQVFIETLNSLGLGIFRLPSEAEWEYACRGPVTHPYHSSRFFFGPNICSPTEEDAGDCVPCELDDYAWRCGGGDRIVGQKLPNAWGLYDMLGNVYEHCQDRWHFDYTGAPTDGSAWEEIVDTADPNRRVTRGAARHYSDAREFRSSRRIAHIQSGTHGSFGLRLVMESP